MVLLRAFGTALAKPDKDPIQVKIKINRALGWCHRTTSKQTNKLMASPRFIWFHFAGTLSAQRDPFSFPLQWCKSGAKPYFSCDGYQAQIKLFRSFLCGLEMSGQAQIWIQVNGLSVKMLESPKGICITLPRWDREGFEMELCCLNRSCCHFSGDSRCFQPGKKLK